MLNAALNKCQSVNITAIVRTTAVVGDEAMERRQLNSISYFTPLYQHTRPYASNLIDTMTNYMTRSIDVITCTAAIYVIYHITLEAETIRQKCEVVSSKDAIGRHVIFSTPSRERRAAGVYSANSIQFNPLQSSLIQYFYLLLFNSVNTELTGEIAEDRHVCRNNLAEQAFFKNARAFLEDVASPTSGNTLTCRPLDASPIVFFIIDIRFFNRYSILHNRYSIRYNRYSILQDSQRFAITSRLLSAFINYCLFYPHTLILICV